MTTVKIGDHDRQLAESQLADHSMDEVTADLIEWRCNASFQLPEEKIKQLVEAGEIGSTVIRLVEKEFDAHVGNESILIERYQMQRGNEVSRLQKLRDEEDADVIKLKKEGRHIIKDGEWDGRTTEQKLTEKFLWAAAAVLWIIGLCAYCYWLHEEAGAGWGEAITSGLVYVIFIAAATHLLLHPLVGKKFWFYCILTTFVIIGFVLLVLSAGLFNSDMFNKTVMHTDGGWNAVSGSSAPQGNNLSYLMVTLRLIGESIIAGALSAIASHVRETRKRFDKVVDSQEFIKDKTEADQAQKNLDDNHSRITHCQRLIQKIKDARAAHIARAEAIFNDLLNKKSRVSD